MELRRIEGAAGSQLEHVRLLPRRTRAGHGFKVGGHAQPCREVPPIAAGALAFD